LRFEPFEPLGDEMETLLALIASLKRKRAAAAEFPIPVRKMYKTGGIFKYARRIAAPEIPASEEPLNARILKSRGDMERLWRYRNWQIAVEGDGK
jgi:hypothetical protein